MARATKKQTAVGRVSGQAEDLYEGLSDAASEALGVLTDRVSERPLTSLAIAFGAGLLFDRLCWRRRRNS